MNDDPTSADRSTGPSHIQVGTRIGNFRIDSYIDRGGMASVFEATDLKLNRRVALKVLANEFSEGSDFRERFVRESRFAASLDHPNIVPIYDAGESDGFLYIAMRYVRGSNLATLLRENGPLDAGHALAILYPLADALDTAHAAGLVHRDVKPANILLSPAKEPDGHRHVYLTDFGLTKRTSALTKLTATGHFIGTMAYVSPEQIRGEQPDASADLYAMACVVYECLTGVPPFVRQDQAALLWAHLNDQPTSLATYRADLLAADPVLERAMAKHPRDRYRTCEEFTQRLAEALMTGRHSPLMDPATDELDTLVPAQADPPGEDTDPLPIPPISTERPNGVRLPRLPPVADEKPSGTEASARTDPARRKRYLAYAGAATVAVLVTAVLVTAVLVIVRISGQPTIVDGRGSMSEIAEEAGSSPSATEPAVDVTAPATSPPGTTGPSPATDIVPVPALAIPALDGGAVDVGSTPGFVAIAPDGRLAYIANRAAGVVTVVDTTINKVISRIPMTAGPPQFIAFTPDGKHAYVSVFNPEMTTNVVAVLDTRTTRVEKIIEVQPKPFALTVTPDQRFVYVPSHDAAAIDIIDIGSNSVVQRIPVAANPHWITLSPDGKNGYITNHESNVVSVLDTSTNAVVGTIGVGTSPHSIAVSPDGTQAAVVCFDSNDLYLIDTATRQVGAIVPVGTNPQDVVYSPDGGYVYTANVDSDNVSVVDTATATVTATIPIDSPTSIAVHPDGRHAYVTSLDSGTLTTITTGR